MKTIFLIGESYSCPLKTNRHMFDPLSPRSVETDVYLQNEATIDCYHGSAVS